MSGERGFQPVLPCPGCDGRGVRMTFGREWSDALGEWVETFDAPTCLACGGSGVDQYPPKIAAGGER